MGIRDEEIKRLEKYAQGLGITILYKKYRKGDPGATMSTDGKILEMYVWSSKSKTRLILDMIHELAHAMSHIYNNRQEDPKTNEALNSEDNRKRGDKPLSKKKRKLIYDAEVFDSQYRDAIWHEVNIKLPKWRLSLDKELDNWFYYHYYKHGEFPLIKDINQKNLELKRKYLNE